MNRRLRVGSLFGIVVGALALAMLLPLPAYAHVGHGATHGFGNGFLHPFMGLDHLLAMTAVGIWAGQRGGRALWLLPVVFVLTMALGGALGVSGVGLPGVEAGIVASVLVLGVLIATAVRFPLLAASVLTAAFALFHGHAHGTEMPATLSGFAYGAGFCTATALLHGAGVALPTSLRRLVGERHPSWLRFAGAGIGAAGVVLIF